MARETLPTALTLIFGDEGGYVNAKTDAGGPTKYGITHKTLAAHRGVASVTANEVKAMKLSEAEDIYRDGYWAQSGGDLLPAGLDYAVFNSGVMSGPARAVRVLQGVVGVTQDGNVGPRTLAAVNAYQGTIAALIAAYCDAYMTFLRSIKNAKTGFPVNGRGWTIRITGKDPKGLWADTPGVIGNALKLAAGAPAQVTSDTAVRAIGAAAAAIPAAVNPWTKPETLAQAVAAIGGMSWLFTGSGPAQWAAGVGLVLAAGVASFYIVRRIRSTPV